MFVMWLSELGPGEVVEDKSFLFLAQHAKCLLSLECIFLFSLVIFTPLIRLLFFYY